MPVNFEVVLCRTNFESKDVVVETPTYRKEMSYAIEVVCPTYAPLIEYLEHELLAEVLFWGLERSAEKDEKDEKEDAPQHSLYPDAMVSSAFSIMIVFLWGQSSRLCEEWEQYFWLLYVSISFDDADDVRWWKSWCM